MIKVLISGYYGFDNFGDEAILYTIADRLPSLDIPLEMMVLSNNPTYTESAYALKSYPRWPLRKVLPVLGKADYLFTGGGSLLQDVTGWRSIPYYLGLTCLARIFKLKNILFAVGVGPVEAKWQRKLLKVLVERIDFISVRDWESLDFLRSLGVKKVIRVIPDPVFLLTPPTEQSSLPHCFEESLEKGRPTLVVAPRTAPGEKADSDIWVNILESLQKQGDFNIFLWPLHAQEDLELCQAISKKTKDIFILEDINNPLKALNILKHCDLLIGVRYHALILGALAGCSLLGITYDPKVTSLLKMLGLPAELELKSLKPELLLKEMERIFSDLAEQKASLREKVMDIREETKKGFQQLAQFLRGD